MKKGVWITVLSISAVLFVTHVVFAAEKNLTAIDILEKVEMVNMTMDQTSLVRMILIDPLGNKKKIDTVRLHKHYGGKKGLHSKSVFFTEFPPDQKGIGFLIWDYAIEGQPDDLWLYLPSLRNVRRMTTRDQHESFLGSDLTFDDMGARRIDEDDHILVSSGDEHCLGLKEPCYVIESIPKEKDSPYGMKRFYISKKDWVPRKIEFFDRARQPFKLQHIQWMQVDDVLVWESSMVRNLKTNHRTVFEISEVQNNTGLSENDFSERVLIRGRHR
ncbi:MAG: outer membrane lipoprotein-sorting protein [Nitrospiria bacterium]